MHTGNTESATAVITLEKEGATYQESRWASPVDATYKAIDKIIAPPECL